MANQFLADLIFRISTNVATLQSGLDKAAQNVKGFEKTVSTSVKRANSEWGNMGQGISRVFSALTGGVVTGVRSLKSLKVAIAGTGIGLLVLAAGALYQLFTKLELGKKIFEGISRAVGDNTQTYKDLKAQQEKTYSSLITNIDAAIERLKAEGASIETVNYALVKKAEIEKAAADAALKAFEDKIQADKKWGGIEDVRTKTSKKDAKELLDLQNKATLATQHDQNVKTIASRQNEEQSKKEVETRKEDSKKHEDIVRNLSDAISLLKLTGYARDLEELKISLNNEKQAIYDNMNEIRDRIIKNSDEEFQTRKRNLKLDLDAQTVAVGSKEENDAKKEILQKEFDDWFKIHTEETNNALKAIDDRSNQESFLTQQKYNLQKQKLQNEQFKKTIDSYNEFRRTIQKTASKTFTLDIKTTSEMPGGEAPNLFDRFLKFDSGGLDETIKQISDQTKIGMDRIAKIIKDTKFEFPDLKGEELMAQVERNILKYTDQIQLGLDVAVQGLETLSYALNGLSQVRSDAMDRELAAVKGNTAAEEAIRKKYFQKEKQWAAAQAIINGAVAIISAWANEKSWQMALARSLAATAAMEISLGMIGAQEFASGGIVYGDTLARVGEYAGARTNPEIIAPLDKLQSLLGNPFGKNPEVKFVIEQDALVGILSNYNSKQTYF
jgi:hypothetical protein